jgi:hypothetical protein
MNINNELALVLERLAQSIENQDFEILKRKFEPNFHECARKGVAWVVSQGKGNKYVSLHYDLYPCRGVYKLKPNSGPQFKYELKEDREEILEDEMKNFYNDYCEKFNFPSKRKRIMNKTMCVLKSHVNFLAAALTPIITDFCKEDRVFAINNDYQELEDIDWDTQLEK